MSCWLGVSPRPFTTPPVSVSAVCLVMRWLMPCNSSRSEAIKTPFALYQGPLPMRSRALTADPPPAALVLRYARHVRLPAFTAFARAWQILSAPSSPPRLAPLPDPVLVTKKLIGPVSGGGIEAQAVSAAMATTVVMSACLFTISSLLVVGARPLSDDAPNPALPRKRGRQDKSESPPSRSGRGG